MKALPAASSDWGFVGLTSWIAWLSRVAGGHPGVGQRVEGLMVWSSYIDISNLTECRRERCGRAWKPRCCAWATYVAHASWAAGAWYASAVRCGLWARSRGSQWGLVPERRHHLFTLATPRLHVKDVDIGCFLLSSWSGRAQVSPVALLVHECMTEAAACC